MSRFSTVTLLVFIIASILSNAHAGPFGLEMGMTAREVKNTLQACNRGSGRLSIHKGLSFSDGVDFFAINMPEKFHGIDFGPTRPMGIPIAHAIHVSNRTGLYKIRATIDISDTDLILQGIPEDLLEFTIKDLHRQIKKKLEKHYGKPTEYDVLAEGSIFDGPDDWLAAIHQGDRTFLVFWGSANPALRKENISLMVLEVQGDSATSASIVLTIEFGNIPKGQSLADR